MRKADTDTAKHIKCLRSRLNSFREVADYVNLPQSYTASFSIILSGGPISERRENKIRRALNLFPRDVKRLANIPTSWLGELVRNKR